MYINGFGLLSFKPQINTITKLVGQFIIFKTVVWLIYHFQIQCLIDLSFLNTVFD